MPVDGRTERKLKTRFGAELIERAESLSVEAIAMHEIPNSPGIGAWQRRLYNFAAASQLGRLMVEPGEFTGKEEAIRALKRHVGYTAFDFGTFPDCTPAPVAVHTTRKNVDYLLPTDRRDGNWYKHEHLYLQFREDYCPTPSLPEAIDFYAELRPTLDSANTVTLYPYIANS